MKIQIEVSIPGELEFADYRVHEIKTFADGSAYIPVNLMLRQKRPRVIKFTEVGSFEEATKDRNGFAYGAWAKCPSEIYLLDPNASEVQWYRREESYE